MYRLTKLRWRRRVRQRKQQVEDIGSNAEEGFDKHFMRRLVRLASVRRFVSVWVLLMALLGGIVVVQTRQLTGYYQELKPVPGGIYSEGIVGSFTNANPLFASTVVDETASKLIFSGLLRYDEKNTLVSDLAETWQVDTNGTTYTVRLRPELVWHDGKPLTADDVVFTFQSAQNPDAKSPLFQAWREVDIKKIDDRTVSFGLKAPFAPFVYSLTTGIIPKHLLGEVEPSQLRSVAFNTNKPVGSGPFIWQALELEGQDPNDREQYIGLVSNKRFHLGQPKLDSFVIKSFISKDNLLVALKERRVDAVVGLDTLPEDADIKSLKAHEAPTTAIFMAFYLTDGGVLKDTKVRSALTQGVDTSSIIKQLGYPVIKANEPFLRNSFAYDPAYAQLGKNVEAANKLLDEAGWLKNSDGQRAQNKVDLSIKLVGLNNFENSVVSKSLQQAWASLGVKVEVVLQNNEDLQPTIANRAYDVLLNAISLGLDPDVYPFWHSSQADPRSPGRLNLSNYSSVATDKALDAGRSRIEPSLRSAKYKPFLQAWKDDNPALAMYQPRFLYITRGDLFFYNPESINSSTDRLNNVHNWMIRQSNTPIN